MRHHNSIFFFAFSFYERTKTPRERERRLFHHHHRLGLHTPRRSHAVCKLIDNLKQNPSSRNGNEFSSPSTFILSFSLDMRKNGQTVSIFAIIYDKTNNISCPFNFLRILRCCGKECYKRLISEKFELRTLRIRKK